MTTDTPDTRRPAGDAPAPVRTWRDPQRHLWLLGIVVPLLPLIGWLGFHQTGYGVFLWMGPIWILGIIPLLDLVVGADTSNPPDWAVSQLEADRYYRWCTYLFVPAQFASLVWGAWLVTHTDLTWLQTVGFAVTVGAVGGIGIANAHELGHKRDGLERWLSRVVLAQSCYGHFYVEHNRGHHSRVATPEDSASSRLGESFWVFLPRCVVGSARSAWGLERFRLSRTGASVWSAKNKVLQAWAMSVALFAAIVALCGPRVLPFLAVQAVFAFSLLEVVNYLEHYGMLRQKVANGRYERCAPGHSWNSNHVASNVFLYNLERHSDHHANPTRRFQTLRHFDEAPQLPSGYGTMIALAYVPPLWRKVMDHRVLAHYGGDVTLANIQPSKRARLLERYGAAAA